MESEAPAPTSARRLAAPLSWARPPGANAAPRSVLREAAAKATAEIVAIEQKLGAEFEKRGKTVVKVNRGPFREATMKLHNGPDATWTKDVYDKLQALK